MSIKIGKIRITEEIDSNKEDVSFFRFKQDGIYYYALSVYLLKDKEGYLVFHLPEKLDKLFKANEFSSQCMEELFKDGIDTFYFVSFQNEDVYTECIEYVGVIEKEEIKKLTYNRIG